MAGNEVVSAADDFRVVRGRERIDLDYVHGFLAESYWASDVTRERVRRALDASECFGLFAANGRQVGFARAVTDYVNVAYLADVFVDADLRGRGLGRKLVASVLEHAVFVDVRRWALATRDAHALYRKLGFEPLARPERMMERIREGARPSTP